MSTSFPLRFTNPETRERLRLVSEQLGTSMNRLVEEMIERELATLSLALESELEETLRRLRGYSQSQIDRSFEEWARSEGQADPISARSVTRVKTADSDPFGVADAFRHG